MAGNQADFVLTADSQEAVRQLFKLKTEAKSAEQEMVAAFKKVGAAGTQNIAAVDEAIKKFVATKVQASRASRQFADDMKKLQEQGSATAKSINENEKASKHASMAVNQMAFAIGDAASVTGGWDQVLRATGNNIQQMALILAYSNPLMGTWAMIATTAAQVALVLGMKMGDSSEKVDEHKKKVEGLEKSYQALAKSVRESAMSEKELKESRGTQEAEAALTEAKALKAEGLKQRAANAQYFQDLRNIPGAFVRNMGMAATSPARLFGFTGIESAVEFHDREMREGKRKIDQANNIMQGIRDMEAKRKANIKSSQEQDEAQKATEKLKQENAAQASKFIGPARGDLQKVAERMIGSGVPVDRVSGFLSNRIKDMLPPVLADEAMNIGGGITQNAMTDLRGEAIRRAMNPAQAQIEEARMQAKQSRIETEQAKLDAGAKPNLETKRQIEELEKQTKTLELIARRLELRNDIAGNQPIPQVQFRNAEQ